MIFYSSLSTFTRRSCFFFGGGSTEGNHGKSKVHHKFHWILLGSKGRCVKAIRHGQQGQVVFDEVLMARRIPELNKLTKNFQTSHGKHMFSKDFPRVPRDFLIQKSRVFHEPIRARS